MLVLQLILHETITEYIYNYTIPAIRAQVFTDLQLDNSWALEPIFFYPFTIR